MSGNWKDPEYLLTVQRYAEVLAESKSSNYVFRGDVSTCMTIIMQADRWNVEPSFLLANAYFDNYGRVAYVGKVYENVISNLDCVSKVTTEYTGEWANLQGKFKTENDIAVPTWPIDDECRLSCIITIEFNNGRTPISAARCLSDIDREYRSKNKSWAMSPNQQIKNYILRSLGHHDLSVELVDMDCVEATHSNEAELAIVKSAVKSQKAIEPSKLPKVDVRHVESVGTPSEYDILKSEFKIVESLLESGDPERVGLALKKIVAAIKEKSSTFSDDEKADLVELYDSAKQHYELQSLAAKA